MLHRFILLDSCSQAEERIHVTVQPQEGAVSSWWLLLEEAERWQDDAGRPHETQGSRYRGKFHHSSSL